MGHLDTLIKNAMTGDSAIDEALLSSARAELKNELCKVISESRHKVDYSITTYDDNDVKVKTPHQSQDTVELPTSVNDRIDKLLKTAAHFAANNGAAFEIINRVVGDGAKEFTEPMMMIVGKNNADNKISDLFADIKKLSEDGNDLKFFTGDNVNSKLISAFNSEQYKKLWMPLFDLLSSKDSLMKNSTITGKGEFALACICSDLTMNAKSKNSSSKTAPDLVLASVSDKSGPDFDSKCIEVKNCKYIKEEITKIRAGHGARVSLKTGATPEDGIKAYFGKGKGFLAVFAGASKDKHLFCVCDSTTKITKIKDDIFVLTPTIVDNDANKLILSKDDDKETWRIAPLQYRKPLQ